jgi:hypothetical protein
MIKTKYKIRVSIYNSIEDFGGYLTYFSQINFLIYVELGPMQVRIVIPTPCAFCNNTITD